MVAGKLFCTVLALGGAALAQDTELRPTNFVVVFCDDLGYGDLGSFGHPTIRTPELDRMAREGMKWMSFYAAAPVCTPSRAGLITGRLPIRNGMSSDRRHVLFPNSAGGLPEGEETIAEVLKGRGYATASIGKWHLGHLPRFLPTRHGFDEFFGIPYSNDMDVERRGDPPIPLLRDEETVEAPVNQTTLTRRYTEESVAFIERNAGRPFFLYLAHTFPHVPLFASEDFLGKSARGLYGDVVEELDWSMGRILDTLRRLELEDQTLVLFTSDNGPWLAMDLLGGSAGSLREGKGTTFEGGMRVPTIAWWPGTIEAGRTTQALGSTLDLMATFAALGGASLPADRVRDSHDLSEVLQGAEESPRETMFFYRGTRLQAVRKGVFKAHYWTLEEPYRDAVLEEHDPPLLYRLDRDPGEQFDVAAEHPEILAEIAEIKAAHERSLVPVVNQLEIGLDRDPLFPCEVEPYGDPCGATLTGTIDEDGRLVISLEDPSLPEVGVLTVGSRRQAIPIFGSGCTLYHDPQVVMFPWPVDGTGSAGLLYDPPPIPGFSFTMQAATLQAGTIHATNALDVLSCY